LQNTPIADLIADQSQQPDSGRYCQSRRASRRLSV
jgi:hypothetical protein